MPVPSKADQRPLTLFEWVTYLYDPKLYEKIVSLTKNQQIFDALTNLVVARNVADQLQPPSYLVDIKQQKGFENVVVDNELKEKALAYIKTSPKIGATSKSGYRRIIENKIPCKTYSKIDF